MFSAFTSSTRTGRSGTHARSRRRRDVVQIQGVRVRFASKIPGAVQYSSIEAEVEMSGTLDDGENVEAVTAALLNTAREQVKAQLRPARTEQRASAGGGEMGPFRDR